MRALCAAARNGEPSQGQDSVSGFHIGSAPVPDLARGSAAAAGSGAGAAPNPGVANREGLEAGFASGPSNAALVRWADFEAALQRVRPSITRGWEAELAPASWDDIGGLDRVKARLRQARSRGHASGHLRHYGLAARLIPCMLCLRPLTERPIDTC